MDKNLNLVDAVEWRTKIWAPAVESALSGLEKIIPQNSSVLEIGYNSGIMSCYLAERFGWNITGYEISTSQQQKAIENAQIEEVLKKRRY